MARRRGAAHGDSLRVAMLDAAGALLHAEGPQALTTRRLADAVDTSTQAIYTLFGGKEGIVRAMYVEGFARLARVLAEVDPVAEPADHLLDLGRAYRTAALKSPHYYDVMFGRPVPEFAPDAEDLARSDATRKVLTDGIVRCIGSGLLREGSNPDEIGAFLWAVAHGVVSLELAGHLDLGPDPVAARSTGTSWPASRPGSRRDDRRAFAAVVVGRLPIRHVRACQPRDGSRVRARARVRRLVLVAPGTARRRRAASDLAAAGGDGAPRRTLARRRVRRLRADAHVRSLRCRRVHRARARRGHALRRAGHEASRRLLLLGLRARRAQRRPASVRSAT